MKTRNKILIFDLRPNIYKVGIYKKLFENCDGQVVFLSDKGFREKYFDERYQIFRKSDGWLLTGLNYKFVSDGHPNIVKNILMLLKEQKNDGYNTILIQGYNRLDYWLILFMGRLMGYKLMFRGEGTIRKSENFCKFLIKSLLLRIINSLSDVIFYTCLGNLKYFEHYIGKDNSQHLWPLSCSVDNIFYQSRRIKNSKSITALKESMNIAEQKKIILFVGQLGKRKRPIDIIKAIKLSEKRSCLTSVFIGAGKDEQKLRKLAQRYQVDARFVGFVEQLQISKFYSIAHVFILPSEYDPSPKVLNEAMNFGLPIIATDVCGQALDLVTSVAFGRVVKVGDVEAISRSIDAILNDLETGRVSEKNIVDKVSEFSFDRNAREILNALEKSV